MKSSKCIRVLFVCVAAAAFACVADAARAQQVEHQAADVGAAEAEQQFMDPVDRGKQGRSVGGHNFSEFVTLQWPFVSNRVTSVTQVGMSTFDRFEGPRGRSLEGDVATFTEEFELGLAPAPFLGFEAQFRGGVISGLDRVGVLFAGGNYIYGGKFRLAIRLIETDHFYLTVRGIGGISRGESASPARLVRAIVPNDDGEFNLEDVRFRGLDLTEDTKVRSAGGSLGAAIGVNRWFGVQVSGLVEHDWIEIGSQDDEEGTVEGGIGLSFDLAPSGVPIQFLASGLVSYDYEDVSDVALTAIRPGDDVRFEPEGGIYYTGTPELELGLFTSGVVSGDETRGRAGAKLGYYW
jgi:hypothetical protein